MSKSIITDSVLAAKMLSDYGYSKQRPLSEKHVKAYLDMMERGLWTGQSIITLGVVGEKTYLLNGYHRLHAVSRFSGQIEFYVIHIPYTSLDDMWLTYKNMDSSKMRLADEMMLTEGMTRTAKIKLRQCIYHMAEGLNTTRRGGHVVLRTPKDIVSKTMDFYAPDYMKFIEVITGGDNVMFMRNTSVMSLGIITMRFQSVLAHEFWRMVAYDDGLKIGHPAKSFSKLLNKHSVGGRARSHRRLVAVDKYTGAAMRCWNNFYNNESRTNLSFKIVGNLAGTPYKHVSSFAWDSDTPWAKVYANDKAQS